MAAHLSIDLDDVIRYGGVREAIAAWCEASGDTACGVVGPSFATSGPGSGWSREHDSQDFAVRAVEEGGLYYLDLDDGRLVKSEEATLDDEWSRARPYQGDYTAVVDGFVGAPAGEEVILLRISPLRGAPHVVHTRDGGESWLIDEDDEIDPAVFAPINDDERVEALEGLYRAWEMPDAEWRTTDGDLLDEDALIRSMGETLYLGEWTRDSVVEIVCPDVGDAVEHPAEVAQMAHAVIDYHGAESDCDAWRDLVAAIKTAAEALDDIEIDAFPDGDA